MRHRLGLLLAVTAVALAATGSAFAFDCIRVSSSYQGLIASTANSGHWLLFDMTNADNVQANLSNFAGTPLTIDQAIDLALDGESERAPPHPSPR